MGGPGWVIGVEDFGANGAYWDMFKKFGFTEENVTRVTKSLLCDTIHNFFFFIIKLVH